MRRAAALIVGGGPAGSAAAITLARGHATPVLVERSMGERDIVCGGFLGWDALAALRRLGIDAGALGACPIHRLRLVSGEQIVEGTLPKPAVGLSRRRLDAALLQAAAQAGAVVLRGRWARGAEGKVVRLDDGEEIDADALFIATGKHELRGATREIGDWAVSVGLRTSLPPRAELIRALADTIELHLYDDGYAGLLVQEDGAVNLCLTVSHARMTGTPDGLIAEISKEAPLLAERVGGASLTWAAVAGVPYGWRALGTEPGVYRVGDQAAVIASLAGDGIAVALASGMQAAQACLLGDGPGARVYQSAFAARARRPVAVAELLRRMAGRPLSRRLMMRLAGVRGLAGMAARLTRIG